MMIAARNAFLMGGAKLPYDAEVEYLESTGTQYIDTGVAVSNPATIALSAEVDILQPLGFTHQGRPSGTWISIYSPPTVPESLYIYHHIYTDRDIVSASETRRTIIYDGATGYYDSGTRIISFAASIGSDSIAGRSWLYGAVWDFGAAAVDMRNSRSGGRLFALSVRVSGSLVRDYIPVRVGSGSSAVGYLYDRANPTGGPLGNGLYGNAADGQGGKAGFPANCVGPDK